MCFLKRKMLQIAEELGLYCNLTNWETGGGGSWTLGFWTRSQKKSSWCVMHHNLCSKTLESLKRQFVLRKQPDAIALALPQWWMAWKLPNICYHLMKQNLHLWVKRSTDAHWSIAGCLRLGRDRCCQRRPNPHLFISAGWGKFCKHHSPAVTSWFSLCTNDMLKEKHGNEEHRRWFPQTK